MHEGTRRCGREPRPPCFVHRAAGHRACLYREHRSRYGCQLRRQDCHSPWPIGSRGVLTLVHELAHEMLHKAERRTTTTKVVKETEAESVAFVVGKAVGLKAGTASADYIHLYHGNASLLAESLEVIQQTAAVILAALQPPTEEQAAMPDAELAKVA